MCGHVFASHLGLVGPEPAVRRFWLALAPLLSLMVVECAAFAGLGQDGLEQFDEVP